MHDYLVSRGFTQSLADPCVYMNFVGDDIDQCVILIVNNDLIICASNSHLLSKVKGDLSTRFKMKDLGVLHWFLGTEFKHSEGAIKMNQTRYISKLLDKFGMTNCKPKGTPAVLGLDRELEAESPELEDPNLYRQIARSLICYDRHKTRPMLRCH